MLNLGASMIMYRRKYKTVIQQDIPAPYVSVDKILKLKMDGLNRYLD